MAKCNYDSKRCQQLPSKIMKTVDERETPRATTAKKKQREKRAWGNKNYYGMVRAK